MSYESVLPLDLCVYAGDTFVFELEWLDQVGDPVDNTDYTALMQARRTRDSVDPPLFSKTESDGITLNGEDGTIDIILSPEDTNQPSTRNVWDIQLVSPGGVVTTLASGQFTVTRDVSRVS